MIDLFNQTKYAHWNVKGPEFMQLHEFFDGVAERVEEDCGLLAERVVTLGVADTVGEFRIGEFLQHCSYKEVGQCFKLSH
jgi:DNA-binding ferritin-like protein